MRRRRHHPAHTFLALAFVVMLAGCGGGGSGEGTDSSISTYALVDTGETTCYGVAGGTTSCDGAGQDGSYSGRQPGFRNNGDGTVTDLVTGLMWQTDPGSKTNWYTANGETAPAGPSIGGSSPSSGGTPPSGGAPSTTGPPPSAGPPPTGRFLGQSTLLSLAGYDDWRIPTIKELYSLINFSGQTSLDGISGKPYIDTSYFVFSYGDESAGERIIDSQYITSTSNVATALNDSETFFGVNFADGRIKAYSKSGSGGNSNAHYALYVRGTSYGVNAYSNNGDGTITDSATGLTWAQNDSGPYHWPGAIAYCEELLLGGQSDWRLPNAKELQSIVDYSRSPDTSGTAAIDPLFSVTPITNEGGVADFPFYWSSTTHLDGPPESMGDHGIYVVFGRALGLWQGSYIDVHGAGSQRSDPKTGNPTDYNPSSAPQGDVIRIFNYARCVRG